MGWRAELGFETLGGSRGPINWQGRRSSLELLSLSFLMFAGQLYYVSFGGRSHFL